MIPPCFVQSSPCAACRFLQKSTKGPQRRKKSGWGGGQGLPWWFIDLRACFPMQGTRVRSLVRELRSHMLCGATKPMCCHEVPALSGKKWKKEERKERKKEARKVGGGSKEAIYS